MASNGGGLDDDGGNGADGARGLNVDAGSDGKGGGVGAQGKVRPRRVAGGRERERGEGQRRWMRVLLQYLISSCVDRRFLCPDVTHLLELARLDRVCLAPASRATSLTGDAAERDAGNP